MTEAPPKLNGEYGRFSSQQPDGSWPLAGQGCGPPVDERPHPRGPALQRLSGRLRGGGFWAGLGLGQGNLSEPPLQRGPWQSEHICHLSYREILSE